MNTAVTSAADHSLSVYLQVSAGVVSQDTLTASSYGTVDLFVACSPSNISCIDQTHYLPIPLVFGQDIKTS